MERAKSRVDLKWELLPIFLVILGFALGLIFYQQRLAPLAKTGDQQYGPDWPDLLDLLRWGIPAASLGVYLFLSLGMWALGKVADPLRDWNAVLRMLGRPTVDDPARKEASRIRLLRGLFLCKIVFGALGLVAQYGFFYVLWNKLGQGAF